MATEKKPESLRDTLEEVRAGLTRLSRKRKVVLSHHESFKLLDELDARLEQALKSLPANGAKK